MRALHRKTLYSDDNRCQMRSHPKSERDIQHKEWPAMSALSDDDAFEMHRRSPSSPLVLGAPFADLGSRNLNPRDGSVRTSRGIHAEK